MKNEKIKEFLTKLAQEEGFKDDFLELKEKVKKKGFSKKDNEKFISECLLPWSKKLGYKLTKKDFIDFDRTQKPTEITGLSPAELENVSGGGFTMLFALFAMFGSALAGGIGGGSSTSGTTKTSSVNYNRTDVASQNYYNYHYGTTPARDVFSPINPSTWEEISDQSGSAGEEYAQTDAKSQKGPTGIDSMDYGLEYDEYEANYGETPVDFEMPQNASVEQVQTETEDLNYSDPFGSNQNMFYHSGTPLVTSPESGSQEQAPGLLSHIGNTLWAGVNKLVNVVHNYAENYMKNYGETSVEEYDRHHGETPADFGSGAAAGAGTTVSEASHQAQPTPAGDTSSPINPSTRHDVPEQTGAAAGQAGGESATRPTAPQGSTGIASMDYYEANYGETPADFATGTAEGDAAGDGGQSVLSQSPQTPNSTPVGAPMFTQTNTTQGNSTFSATQNNTTSNTTSESFTSGSSQNGQSWKDFAKQAATGAAGIIAAVGVPTAIAVGLSKLPDNAVQQNNTDKTKGTSKKTEEKTSIKETKKEGNDFALSFMKNLQKTPEAFEYLKSPVK